MTERCIVKTGVIRGGSTLRSYGASYMCLMFRWKVKTLFYLLDRDLKLSTHTPVKSSEKKLEFLAMDRLFLTLNLLLTATIRRDDGRNGPVTRLVSPARKSGISRDG